MRTVSKLTKDQRQKRAYQLTQRWQLAQRTKHHEAEAAAFARFEDAIAPQWRPFIFMLDKARQLAGPELDALKVLFRAGLVIQAPDTYLEPIDAHVEPYSPDHDLQEVPF